MRDTIAAIASGMTASGIGIVRISGPGAFRVLEKIFRFASPKKKLSTLKANTIHYGHIYDGEEQIDEVLVMLMKAPHTYTAEDTVEIDCHGGPYVMQKILEAVLRAGARMAEPGEFTKRAFLNGRIDLTGAEAVMDVISSGSEDALKSSLMQLGGSLKREIRSLREEIITEVAFIESALDDPEHYDLTGHTPDLIQTIEKLLERLGRLAASFTEGRLVREGIYTVILGKPNAGKSSLLNYVSGMERAIVTDIAGTTRDTLEETVRIGGIVLRIADTAGIRNTGDVIEKIGVERAKKSAEQADLILAVFDTSVPFSAEDDEIFETIRGKRAIVLLNKSDLPPVFDSAIIRERCDAPVLSISAREEQGIEELSREIRSMFFGGRLHMNEQTMITNIRHKECVDDAIRSLELVKDAAFEGMPEDFYTVDLMDAYAALGRILGEQVEDDLVDTIFAKFCMGK